MTPSTPDEWLPILAKRLDERAPELQVLRSYADGNAPMPEMGRNVRASWQAFQKKARGGFGYLIASALANRLVPLGVTVGGSTETAEAQVARRIWRDNRCAVAFGDAMMDALQVRVGYIVVGSDAGGAVITRELPEQMIAATDPLRPWRSRAALKVWRDGDAGMDFAQVWIEGERQTYARPIKDQAGLSHSDSSKGWARYGDPERFDGPVPVVVLENRDGIGEYERHTDIIDRINLGVLNRLVVVAMQAFRQRALKGESLPDVDEDGNAIEWERIFEPAPGALWDLPAGVDIWESAQTDITPLLTSVKDDLRDLSAVSETPLAMLVPDGANQTAEGAAFQREAIIFKSKDRIRRWTAPLELVMVYALRAAGVENPETVEILWEPPDRVSVTEKYAAAAQAKAAGESWKSIARNILGYSPEQIKQDELDRAAEQLSMGLLGGVTNAGQSGTGGAQ